MRKLIPRLLGLYIILSIIGIIPPLVLITLRWTIPFIILIIVLLNTRKIVLNKKEIQLVFWVILFSCYAIFISLCKQNNSLECVSILKMNLFFVFFFISNCFTEYKDYHKIEKTFAYSCTIQAFVTIVVFLLCIFHIIPLDGTIRFFDFQIYSSDGFSNKCRVVTRLQPFLLAGFWYSLLCEKRKIIRCLFSCLFLYALYISKTIGFYLALIAGFGFYIVLKFRISNKIKLLYPFLSFVIAIFLLGSANKYIKFQGAQGKSNSMLIKQQQVSSIAELSKEELFTGNGIGFKFYNDQRQTGDTEIEVIPVYWIFTVGLIGFLLYYIVCFYTIHDYIIMKRKDRHLMCYIIIQYCFIFTGLSNPYMASGSTAYICILLYFIRLNVLRKYQNGQYVISYNNK